MSLPKPRIVIEQSEDGSFAIEYYINGARVREVISAIDDLKGLLVGTFATINAMHKSQAARKIELDAEKALRRQKDLWWHVQADHGIELANRVIGNLGPRKAQRLVKPLPTPNPADFL